MGILDTIKDYLGSAEVSSAASISKLKVNGIADADTIKLLQGYFGTKRNGVLYGQKEKLIKNYAPNIKSVSYKGKPSACVKKMQAWVGFSPAYINGIWDRNLSYALQIKLTEEGFSTGVCDAVFGKNSVKALQRFLNAQIPQPEPTPVPTYSSIGEMANAFAYAGNDSKAKYPGGKPKTAYKAGLNKAYPKRPWSAPAKAGASCDVFVGTCVRCAGVDPNYPRGLSENYTKNCGKFVKVSKNDVRDGDILFVKISGHKHVCIAYGGKVKEASYNGFYPKTTNTLKKRIAASTGIYRAK